jgi:hypothetical protein
LAEQLGEALRRLDLLMADLGMGVDPIRGLNEFLGAPIHRLAHPLFQLLHTLLWHPVIVLSGECRFELASTWAARLPT